MLKIEFESVWLLMTKNGKKSKILIFSEELLYTPGSAWRAFLGALKAQKSPKMIPTSFKGKGKGVPMTVMIVGE